MTVDSITKALGGCKTGGGSIARCPAHNDRRPSLSIRDGGNGMVLVYCHAGCTQSAVVAALKARGLWPGGYNHNRHRAVPRREPGRRVHRHEAARRDLVVRKWRQTEPAVNTLVAGYLASRGIVCPLSPDLRFHPRLRHPSGAYAPAMVAAVRNLNGELTGLHRTWIEINGAGKAKLSPAKAMLGICRCGAVRLAKESEELGISEGIESGLSVQQATGLPVWAALSTSGLTGLVLPARVRRVIILADGDEPGEKAAQTAAARWCHEGREVRIARPPRGTDFNDLLVGHSPFGKEGLA